MTTYESEIKMIDSSDSKVFAMLSDLRNVEKIKDRIPSDKVKDLKFDQDTVSVNVDPVGDLSLKIIEREPCKTIKFTTDKSPVDSFVWIQILPVTDEKSKIKVTLKADMNPMIKMMIGSYMEKFVNMFADALTKIPY
ncbi:MAG: SRPBCC family protein [Bacteroidales bacterium]|jgi:hypothetical protein|nr:SRPBCC family protein [Bacteroidales bacterium]MBP5135235.1 SRPBCC family protein [Paludibacteraceae bacterium]MBR6310467.1 SRPBCC family protein [Paludibacteraceae bacterium]MDD6357502.1 SRPBCC family protein [Bacteroidales bacterium]